MYYDLREVFRLECLKMYVEEFVAMFPNCHQVKAEYQELGGSLQ